MNERLKEEHPEVYRDAFAAQRIAAIAGGSIVVSPLTAVLSLGAIATSESAGFDFEAGVPWGIGIGLAVSVVLNIVYLARLRHQKKDQATLLNIARTTYPGARPFISDEAVYFKPV